ncbi:tail tape measure protein [Altererythrobacter confluentis]|uniref:Tail tape measure protein n=1 Tax=Allopontixanthobacter confluentis TaxID=1849021 RepID=A0A6L7GHI5_9SPHN|nr:tail tape measure protein [Allopontixanthobacter confluentis]MXP15040.1 tail tape measure protein [Allopontixanthobacter confluentis]
MDDQVDELLIDVRASTRGFAADIAEMRGTFDSTLVDGFSKAGSVLERGLLTAIRQGGLGFEDLKRMAFQALDQIAAQALKSGIGSLFGGGNGGQSGSGDLGGIVGGALGAIFGLPGRATGGPVSPGRGYLVGERGPELFVPTSAGRVETGMTSGAAGGRDVRVAINLSSPRGSSAPVALQRSSRQVASAVRRALREF